MAEPHVEKETLAVSVNIPAHDPRTASPLFARTRKLLILRDKGCFICGTKHLLEAHHHPVEWSFATMIDFSPASQIRKDFPQFDWGNFKESNPYTFVDNMLFNGMLLCKKHHTGLDEGIHLLPHPIWVAQRYGREGYNFSKIETIHHQK